MHWHADQTMSFEVLVGPGEWLRIKALTLRGYLVHDGFKKHLDFDAVAQAVIHGNGLAFVFGAKTDGKALSRSNWLRLGALLRDEHGVSEIVADRDRRRVCWSTARAGI